jgi:hypothetical protein
LVMYVVLRPSQRYHRRLACVPIPAKVEDKA